MNDSGLSPRFLFAATFSILLWIGNEASSTAPWVYVPSDVAGPRFDEPFSTPDDESIVRVRLARFDDALRHADPRRNIRGVESIATTIHPLVADALLDVVTSSTQPDVVAAAYRALSHQHLSKARIVAHVRDILQAAANAEATFLDDLAVVAVDESHAIAARRRIRDRGHVLTEAQRCLVALEQPDPEFARALRAFLADPSDELVVATLDTLATWHVSDAIPDVLDLFHAYPEGDRYVSTSTRPDQGALTDEWKVILGRCERPGVYWGVRRFLKTLTDRTFASPVELEGYLESGRFRLIR